MKRSCVVAFFFACFAGAAAFARPPLTAQHPPITALAFAPDGKAVVSGSQAGIEVRSWPDLKRVKSLKTHLAHVHDLAFSPDGSTLAAAGGSPGESGQVEWFAWPAGESRGHIGAHDDLVYRVAWIPSRVDVERGEERLVTASADHLVMLHSRQEGSKPVKLSGHSRTVLAAVFLPDGKTVVSAGVDQSLRVWDVSTGRLLRTLDNHTAAVNDLAVRQLPPLPEGEGATDPPLVASAAADRTVRLWQPTIGRLVRFARLPSAALDIEWTSDGRLVASCVDGRVRVLDPKTVKIVADLPALDGWAYSLALSPDNRSALVGGIGGVLRVVTFPETAATGLR